MRHFTTKIPHFGLEYLNSNLKCLIFGLKRPNCGLKCLNSYLKRPNSVFKYVSVHYCSRTVIYPSTGNHRTGRRTTDGAQAMDGDVGGAAEEYSRLAHSPTTQQRAISKGRSSELTSPMIFYYEIRVNKRRYFCFR